MSNIHITMISDGYGNPFGNAKELMKTINNFDEITKEILDEDNSVQEKIDDLTELENVMYSQSNYIYSNTALHDVISLGNMYREKIILIIDELEKSINE